MTKVIPETPPDYDKTRIVERPDGFYWINAETGKSFGPFATLAGAVQDMDYNAETDFEPAESLQEAEDELGLAGWVDPDTGELAEDTFTHLEDH
ncbi:MAG: hypothetical protein P4L70_11260 [Parasulfuritortus sp.]|jgi:hypothetical protein|nr:hypothetical protein [Parasulfuritortus sp.]